MATKNESKAYISWRRNLFYSLIPALIIGIPSAFFPTHTWVQAVIIGFLTTGLGFVILVQIEIIGFFRHEVDYNPIIMALPEISNKIKEIPHLFTKNGSVDFAFDSLKRMSNEGFVQVNVTLEDYIKYLTLLIENTKISLYGTNIFRPKIIEGRIKKHTPGISEYLKIMRESKCKNKIRINIISKSDIINIIQDAVKALTITDGRIEFCENEFIPEIVWYLKEINGRETTNKVDLLWTTHDLAIDGIRHNKLPKSETSNNEIDDYAIFDKQILFLYDYNNAVSSGTMVLQWDLESKENSKVGKYLAPFLNIPEQVRKKKIFKDTNLFLSFSELIDRINWENEHVDINGSDIDIGVRNAFQGLKDKTLKSIYEYMKANVKEGNWKFKEEHFINYLNAKI
ncbi:MAG: hypothetical protein NUV74_12310 [Candidatus Brocadiaceae bacterium]|nr:hypothetical protein [Candidatus Brocadiaceae bacterium]